MTTPSLNWKIRKTSVDALYRRESWEAQTPDYRITISARIAKSTGETAIDSFVIDQDTGYRVADLSGWTSVEASKFNAQSWLDNDEASR